ncbi:hypothetical protein [Dyadobacter sp.]|uniref:hypothetical protein n=1 Tax=Dyadobacter sp. TaxID=1914288 RepID=UPI003F71C8B2
MNSTSPITEREIFRIIGLSESDLLKVDDPESVWIVYAFEQGTERPIAAFTGFMHAFDLASRLNAFVENGIGIQPVPGTVTNIKVDRYRQLTEVGMTPFLIRLKSHGNMVEVIDGVASNLDEISLENNISGFVSNVQFRKNVGWEFELMGTFWASSRRLAISKARTFASMVSELQNRTPGLLERKLLFAAHS